MAGRPLARAARQKLTDAEDEVFEKLAEGMPVTRLCESMGFSTPPFYEWLREAEGRYERFQEVRELAAHGLVEEALQLVDEARKEGGRLTAAQASLVRQQASDRKWLAGKFNDLYSDKVRHEMDADSFADSFRAMLLEINKVEHSPELAAEEAEYELLDEAEAVENEP